MQRMIQLFCVLAIAVAVAAGGTKVALAAASDYSFKLASETLAAGVDAVIAVRLINEKSGTPVENAVIFQTRLDMSPDGMGAMTSPVTALGQSEPGVYRFNADLTMAGRWALSLAAKVPGEQETIRDTVVIVAE